jgi:hypothetical protein
MAEGKRVVGRTSAQESAAKNTKERDEQREATRMPTQEAPGMTGLINESRATRVARAKEDGSFAGKRNQFNAMNKQRWMDEKGAIRVGPNITADGQGGKKLEGKYGTGSVSTVPAQSKVAGGPEPIQAVKPDPGKLPDTLVAKREDMMHTGSMPLNLGTGAAGAALPSAPLPGANQNSLLPGQSGLGTIQGNPGAAFNLPKPFQKSQVPMTTGSQGMNLAEEAQKKRRPY